MRIVALADTHMFHHELSVPRGDVLVHAGDLCRGGDLEELSGALDWMKSLPHPTKILVAGNHDWAFANDPEQARALCGCDIIYLQDSGTTVDGVRFWGSPWQPAFNDWAFNLDRGEPLARKWALIPSDIDVLITHSPPQGIGDHSSTGGRQGCADLGSRVRQLAVPLHIFGHIHEDGGAWIEQQTLFVNVTTWECERPPTVLTWDQRSPTVVSLPAARAHR